MEVMAFTGFNKSMPWVRHFVEHMVYIFCFTMTGNMSRGGPFFL